MPPKNCDSCQKLVYPMEQLKCLDKTWHKACFKCQVCSMTLNMKNYKGYNKLPYCNAHYPSTKFTAVADTPENMRIKQNTKIQSNITYHAEFEAAKGQKTSVADDPETLRVKKNMNTISNVAYHGELARKQDMENARPTEIDADVVPPQARVEPAPRRQPGSISDYDPTAENRSSPYTNKTQATTVFNSTASSNRQAPKLDDIPTEQPVSGKPAPVFTQPEVPAPRQPSPVREPTPPPVRAPSPEPVREPTPPPPREPTPPPPAVEPQQEPVEQQGDGTGKGFMSKALYDYAAADEDEVGFEENDIIINCEAIDEGWMTGTVEKTGLSGMLPSNYVEKLNW